MNTFVTKGKKLKSLAYTALAAAVATGAASAQLTTDAATTAITDATTKGTSVVVAGFAIGAVFLVAKVIRRGMRSAG